MIFKNEQGIIQKMTCPKKGSYSNLNVLDLLMSIFPQDLFILNAVPDKKSDSLGSFEVTLISENPIDCWIPRELALIFKFVKTEEMFLTKDVTIIQFKPQKVGIK